MTNLITDYLMEVIMSTLKEKGQPRKEGGRKRIYPPAFFVDLKVMKALKGKSNNGMWKTLRRG